MTDDHLGASPELEARIYADLKRLARRRMSLERGNHTLQPTALVNEVWLGLSGSDLPWNDHAQVMKLAARAMRNILVDHARRKRADKRGAGAVHVTLGQADAEPEQSLDVMDLHEAMDELAGLDARKAQILELHYFAGMGHLDIAEALSLSRMTIHRELTTAIQWLRVRLQAESSP